MVYSYWRRQSVYWCSENLLWLEFRMIWRSGWCKHHYNLYCVKVFWLDWSQLMPLCLLLFASNVLNRIFIPINTLFTIPFITIPCRFLFNYSNKSDTLRFTNATHIFQKLFYFWFTHNRLSFLLLFVQWCSQFKWVWGYDV